MFQYLTNEVADAAGQDEADYRQTLAEVLPQFTRLTGRSSTLQGNVFLLPPHNKEIPPIAL